MPTKKSSTSTARKGSAVAGSHATYQDMVKEAILNLKDRNGSSRQAIKKYIQSNNDLGATTEAAFSSHLSKALSSGETSGIFSRPKGPSGPVKLAKKDSSKAVAKPVPAATTKAAPKAATKKTTTTTKKTADSKPATKKSTTATAKKATKTKANASRPRKAAPAPAVETKPVILGKTKSGRITKNIAAPPTGGKLPTRRTTTKKAAPKKAASTPKKAAASPKKADAA